MCQHISKRIQRSSIDILFCFIAAALNTIIRILWLFVFFSLLQPSIEIDGRPYTENNFHNISNMLMKLSSGYVELNYGKTHRLSSVSHSNLPSIESHPHPFRFQVSFSEVVFCVCVCSRAWKLFIRTNKPFQLCVILMCRIAFNLNQ